MIDMRLHNDPFQKIKNGTKTIEVRLNDEKRQQIKIGDEITFTNRVTEEQITTKVTNIYKFNNFKELYNNIDKTKIGYAKDEEANPSDMEQYYTKEDQEKYGVIGIEIELV